MLEVTKINKNTKIRQLGNAFVGFFGEIYCPFLANLTEYLAYTESFVGYR
jgi:hypothetical protein